MISLFDRPVSLQRQLYKLEPSVYKLLVTESANFDRQATAEISQIAKLVLADVDRQQLLAAADDVDILWVRLRHQIDHEIFEAARRLKYIVTPTTGLDHIHLDEASRRGVRVLSLRGEANFLKDVHATAELALLLILAAVRNLRAPIEHVLDGGWNRSLFLGGEVHGTTVGIVGYGRLGSLVSEYLLALGARVLAADPHVDRDQVDPRVELVPLTQLLAEAEIVTLHVDLRSDNRCLIGREQLARMKPGAWFINTARGALVDENALLDSLESGHLGGAALDVLGGEDPGGMAHHPLVRYARSHENLLITPHIGGFTESSLQKTERFMARQLREVLCRETMRQACDSGVQR